MITSLAFTLYIDTIFRRAEAFDLRLIGQFDDFLFNVGTEVAQQNDFKMTSKFLAYLNDGPRFRPSLARHPNELVCDFQKLEGKQDVLDEFARRIKRLFNLLELNQVEFEWKDLVLAEKPDVNLETKSAEILSSAEGWLKLNHLRECLFDVGAWCVKEQNYDFLNAMWEFHQPPDSTATFGENTLLPSTLEDTLEHYLFVRRPHDRDFDFSWPGHHGKGGWFRQYIVFHLVAAHQARLEDVSWKRHENKEQIIEKLLRGFDRDHDILKSVQYDIQELLKSAEFVSEQSEQLGVLKSLRLLSKDNANPIYSEIIPLLQAISNAIDQKLVTAGVTSDLSNALLSDFVTRVHKGFLGGFTGGFIIATHGTQVDSPPKVTFTPPPIFSKHWLPRELFIENWYVDGSELGPEYGNELARQADFQLLTQMAQIAKKKSFAEFIAIVAEGGRKLVSISSPNSVGYSTSWHREFDFCDKAWNEDESDCPTSQGTFKVGSRIQTVYTIRSPLPLPIPRESVLVGPDGGFGALKVGGKEPVVEFGIKWLVGQNVQDENQVSFWIGIGELTEEEIEKVLKVPPDWLREKGDSDDNRRRWLQTHLVLWLRTQIEWTYSPENELWLVSP